MIADDCTAPVGRRPLSPRRNRLVHTGSSLDVEGRLFGRSRSERTLTSGAPGSGVRPKARGCGDDNGVKVGEIRKTSLSFGLSSGRLGRSRALRFAAALHRVDIVDLASLMPRRLATTAVGVVRDVGGEISPMAQAVAASRSWRLEFVSLLSVRRACSSSRLGGVVYV